MGRDHEARFTLTTKARLDDRCVPPVVDLGLAIAARGADPENAASVYQMEIVLEVYRRLHLRSLAP